MLLERAHFEVVGEVDDGDAAVRMVEALQPDILILDRAMPKLDGLEVAREISRRPEHPQMILLTVYVAAYHVLAGIERGIRGFVAKNDAADELLTAVNAVSDGQTFLSTSAVRAMYEAHLTLPRTPMHGA